MNLRLPGSGSMFEALLDSFGRTAADLTGANVVSSVSEEQLDRALDALAFLQAAGAGAGPYAVQFCPGSGGDLIEIGRAADAAAMRETLRRYRRGDPIG